MKNDVRIQCLFCSRERKLPECSTYICAECTKEHPVLWGRNLIKPEEERPMCWGCLADIKAGNCCGSGSCNAYIAHLMEDD